VTDQDTFNKLVAKLVPDAATLAVNFKPKLRCTCNDGTFQHYGIRGVVVLQSGTVSCGAPSFNADGSFSGFSLFCNPYLIIH